MKLKHALILTLMTVIFILAAAKAVPDYKHKLIGAQPTHKQPIFVW